MQLSKKIAKKAKRFFVLKLKKLTSCTKESNAKHKTENISEKTNTQIDFIYQFLCSTKNKDSYNLIGLIFNI